MKRVALKRLADLRLDRLHSVRPLVALENLESWSGHLAPDSKLGNVEPGTTGVAAVSCGDVLFGKLRPYLAKGWVADRPVAASTELLCLRPRDTLDSRFLGYVTMTAPFIESAVAGSEGSKMPRTSWEKVGAFRMLVPPLEEQRAIADYLDTETTRIDALITKKRRLAQLLEERVDAFGQRLVQGGGGSQPTPIPTIPRVPAEWRVLRNKVFMQEALARSATGEEEMLSVSHLTGVTPRSEKTVYMFEAESTAGYKLVRPGDLVINTMWAWMGAAGVASKTGIVSPAYGVYHIDTAVVDPAWYDLLVRTQVYITEMTRYSRGVTSSRLRLYPDEFLALSAPVPPIEEQVALVRQYGKYTGRVKRAIRTLGEQLNLLTERRQALITAAVTGELEITGVAA